MPDMRIADFLRHDAQTYGVPGAPSIEKILEACVAAANWIDELESRLAQVERERDALMHDLMIDHCEACKHGPASLDDCNVPWSKCKFEWRGVCPEAPKEE